MVAMQDKPLAAVFHQMGSGSGAFPPVVENYERGKTIFFPAIPLSAFIF